MTAPRIFAGASGYSYKEWKSHFYPEDIKPDAMLAYYAERLPTVEINNTFYRMPKKDMSAVADGLTERGIATLRYQFPYMERGSKRPDAPRLAQATVRAAVAEASRLAPGLALFAGGKSYGGRMTSQAHAEAPLPEVRGLVFRYGIHNFRNCGKTIRN